jgi:hypothetical protein
MNVDELRDVLVRHVPDPGAVMTRLAAKQRARRRHQMALGGSAAGIALAVAATALAWPGGHPNTPMTHAAPSAAAPVASPPPSAAGPAVADGCAFMPLPDVLASARQAGASIVIAHGTLTGRRATDPQVEMALDAVQTLAGPPVADHTTVWLYTATGPSGPIPGADAGSLWATDGALFGVVWPQRLTGSPTGATMRVAPVVDQQVILSSAGCWSADGLTGRPFTGKLAEVPGSDSYARAARTGLTAVPLDTVRRAAQG